VSKALFKSLPGLVCLVRQKIGLIIFPTCMDHGEVGGYPKNSEYYPNTSESS
jgi:hypothetical protein